MKKFFIKKIFFILLIICTIFSLFNTKIYASGSFVSEADDFVNSGQQTNNNLIRESTLKTVNDMIYSVLLTIAIILAIIVGAIMGIYYMVASVGERARIQQGLIPYTIGCLIVFLAFGIWKLVVQLLSS